jgi:hypothetical protein
LVQGDDVLDGEGAGLVFVCLVPDAADHGGTGPAGELGGQGSDSAEDAVHEDGASGDRAVGEDGAVGGDAGDAEAGAEFVADAVG